MRPVCLIIRDGWGYNENTRANSVLAAKTPVMNTLKEKYPWTLLDAAGEAVGLPEGYMGSSEVGHLNMGAGRIVIQELKRIDDGLRTGEVFEYEKWKTFIKTWKDNASRLHLLILLQDEGVHGHQEHLFKVMRRARQEWPEGEIVIHPFLDGRDTPPRSSLEYLAKLDEVMQEVGGCRIGTAMGRYYAMDRNKTWHLTDEAYACLTEGKGRSATTAEEAVNYCYENDQTPDHTPMTDEYVTPYVINGYKGMRDGDCVMNVNYRQDREIQITMAFIDDAYPGVRAVRPHVAYLGFTQYYDEFTEYLLPSMSEGGSMGHLLGEVVADAGLRQLRIAETQKYRHVTSFINGKATTPYPGEDDVEVKSDIDPATYASEPQMAAYQVTDELLHRLENNPYDLILVNLANCDMVGHTGDPAAAAKAVEVVDECVGRIVSRMLDLDGITLITSDHGNAEQMEYYENGRTKTSHTMFPVDCTYVASDSPGRKMVEHGILSDVAPTLLYLLGLQIPEEMTSKNLILS